MSHTGSEALVKEGAPWWMNSGAVRRSHVRRCVVELTRKLMKGSFDWRWNTAQSHLFFGLFRDSIGMEG